MQEPILKPDDIAFEIENIPTYKTVIENPKGDILELVDEGASILKEKMELFDFAKPPIDPFKLAYDLVANLKHYKGLGIAANQLGLPYRAFAMETSPNLVCFNPKIVDDTSEQVILEEGCLSYPNLFVRIKRTRSVRVRFTMPNGQTTTQIFSDLTARVFQHELDHLEGIIFYSRAGLIARREAFNKRKQLNRRK